MNQRSFPHPISHVSLLCTMIHCWLFRECACDTGFSKVDMYSGVRSFNALYVNTALLKGMLFGTENQPSPLNIHVVSDGVLHSACNIIRAVR